MMRGSPFWLGLLCLAPTPAQAEEETAQPEAPPRHRWIGSVAAGAARADGGDAGQSGSVSLTRQTGASYVRASLSHYSSTLRQIDAVMHPRYWAVTLGWGGNRGGWLIDTYATAGRQSYGTIVQAGMARAPSGSGSSGYYAAGGNIGRSTAIGRNWYGTVNAGLSYAQGKMLHPAPRGIGLDQESTEPALSGAATLRIDRGLGTRRPLFIGAYAGLRTTTNATSELAMPSAGSVPPGPGFQLALVRHGDTWLEGGATAIVEVSRGLSVEGFVARTAGQRAGNAITAGLGMRFGL